MLEGGVGSRGQAPAAALKGLRIGALDSSEPEFVLDPQVKARVEAFAADLAREGVEVTRLASPVDCAALLAAYRTLLTGVLAEDLPPATLKQMQRSAAGGEDRGLDGRRPESAAALALAYTQSHLEWLAANEVRARLAAEAKKLFDRFDAILAPIAPVPAFPHDHRPFEKRTARRCRTGRARPTWRCCAGSRWPPPAGCRRPPSRSAARQPACRSARS